MITYKQGNIFTSKCQVIVNTVNCSGVMGAGIALELKWRYPEMFEVYAKQCKEKQLKVGMLAKYKDHQQRFGFDYVLNFPTKNNWKLPSTLKMIEQGLDKFSKTYEACGFTSIAFPFLGVGRGGLDGEQVKSLMEKYLSALPLEIEIWEYDPNAEDDLITRFREEVVTSSERELTSKWKVTPKVSRNLVQNLSSNKCSSLMQLAQVPGIGEATMVKLYAYAATKPVLQDSLF